MKELFKATKNINVHQGNALDLKEFNDNTYDLVLELGPVYHLHKIPERIAAIKEAVRVAKKGAPIFVAFVLQDGLSHVIRDSVNNMSEASYNEWLQYLIATAERTDLMGYSNHVVQIFIKN